MIVWVTPKQLAEELQVPLQTIYIWNHKGTGPKAYKFGKHVRYRRDDIDAWQATSAA